MKDMSFEHVFGMGGPLAGGLDRYEFRQGQVDMARAVRQAIEEEGHLIVEAGTGVGKSFAYLVPFVEWTVSKSKRLVIATYSKALQEQLVKKDLPFLEKSLGWDFRYAPCFGGENYLCRRRLERTLQQGLFETKREAGELEEILKWAAQSPTGLRLELDFEPQEKVWFRICRQSDLCRGKRCSYRGDCFYAKARAAWSQAHLLVANHHLFFADLTAGRQILPAYDGVIFDEAHNLEEVAAEHFGFELSNTQLKYMLDEFHHPRYQTGFFRRLKGWRKEGELVVLINAVRQAQELFFSQVLDSLGGRAALSFKEAGRLHDNLSPTMEQMTEAITEKIEKIEDEEDKEDVAAHTLRLKGWAAGLNEFVEQKRERHVYWAEAESRAHLTKCRLCAAPVEVAPYLKKFVFDQITPVVLTSATMAVRGRFEFIKQRWGLEAPQEVILPSPFDFENQTILYTPRDLPDPSVNEAGFARAISLRIEELIKITKGRTFVLFTSYQMLGLVYDLLIDKLTDYALLRQGDLPRWQLLEKFKKEGDAVLFGTATFWQGVDVPGSALENVIITRLPFAVPDHPLTEARIMDLQRQGKDAFMGYQVPRAVLLFKQGFGRLIRHRNDVGIVAILDPRVRTRFYGRAFLESLPPCKEVEDMTDLGASFILLKSNAKG